MNALRVLLALEFLAGLGAWAVNAATWPLAGSVVSRIMQHLRWWRRHGLRAGWCPAGKNAEWYSRWGRPGVPR